MNGRNLDTPSDGCPEGRCDLGTSGTEQDPLRIRVPVEVVEAARLMAHSAGHESNLGAPWLTKTAVREM